MTMTVTIFWGVLA